MKKFLCFIVSVIFVVSAFSGCTSEDYSAKIKDLEDRLESLGSANVEALEKSVIALEATVASLSAALEEAKNSNASLEKLVGTMQNSITSLTATVASMENTLNSTASVCTVLKTEIDSLTAKYNNETSGNAALKAKIDSLQAKFDNETIGNAALKTQLDELKAKYDSETSGNAALKAKIDSLQANYNNEVSGNTALKSQIDALKGTVATINETLISSSVEIEQLKTEVSSLQTEISEANSMILLLKGKADNIEDTLAGNVEKIYTIDDTLTYSSGGIKLFSIKIDKVWWEGIDRSCFVEWSYTNIGFPNDFTLDQMFVAAMKRSSNAFDYSTRYNDSAKHRIDIDNTVSFKQGNTDYPALRFVESEGFSSGVKKVYFGIFTRTINNSPGNGATSPFIPFGCFELDFQPLP